jgi:haloalkane dehalogenase
VDLEMVEVRIAKLVSREGGRQMGRSASKSNLVGRRGVLASAAALAGGAVLGAAADNTTAAAATGPADTAKVVRTPAARFAELSDYPFKPNYVSLDLGDGSGDRVRMHYLDERPKNPEKASGQTILLLHGNPSWSYLYRHVIPPLVAAGHRCVALDLIGFGKSDKLVDRFAYTFQNHIDWLSEAIFERLELHDLTMVCHDWGGMLGLNLLAARPERFVRVVASNFGLSEGGRDLGPGWSYLAQWLQFTQRTEQLDAGQVIENFSVTDLDRRVRAGYNAPFPADPHLHGFRRFATLIPITSQDEANRVIRNTWKVLETLHTPFLCVFSDQDHVFHGDNSGLSGRIPGAQGQPHVTLTGAAHFLQEDKPAEFAAAVDTFINLTK